MLAEHRLRYMRWDGVVTLRGAQGADEPDLFRRLKGYLWELRQELQAGRMPVRQFAAEVEFLIWSFGCDGAGEATRKKRGGYTHGKRKTETV